MNILRIDSSARKGKSITRALCASAIEQMHGLGIASSVVTRDLLDGVSLLKEDTALALTTAPDARTQAQSELLRESDSLVAELKTADCVLIGCPIYNFSVPAALKAYFDLIARARVTFRYSADGPVGLLTGKRALVLVASGGTGVGSDIDFATGYVRHFLGFLGIDNVRMVAADRMTLDSNAVARAKGELTAVVSAMRDEFNSGDRA